MRPVLVPIVLGLTLASPASASRQEATGGVTAAPAATGGAAVPGEARNEPATGEDAPPASGLQAGAAAERSAAAPGSALPAPAGAGAVGGRVAQEGAPDTPPAQGQPDEEDVDVQVPVEGGGEDGGAAQPTRSDAALDGLPRTGLEAAAFAVLGAGAAAAGLGLRRMAR